MCDRPVEVSGEGVSDDDDDDDVLIEDMLPPSQDSPHGSGFRVPRRSAAIPMEPELGEQVARLRNRAADRSVPRAPTLVAAAGCPRVTDARARSSLLCRIVGDCYGAACPPSTKQLLQSRVPASPRPRPWAPPKHMQSQSASSQTSQHVLRSALAWPASVDLCPSMPAREYSAIPRSTSHPRSRLRAVCRIPRSIWCTGTRCPWPRSCWSSRPARGPPRAQPAAQKYRTSAGCGGGRGECFTSDARDKAQGRERRCGNE